MDSRVLDIIRGVFLLVLVNVRFCFNLFNSYPYVLITGSAVCESVVMYF